MGNAIYMLGESPTINVNNCSGSLEIEGWSQTSTTISTDSMPRTTQQDGQLVIEHCDDDLRLEVPTGATVVVGHADGDVRARHLTSLQLGHISSDLDLGNITQSCSVRHVDGDVRVRDVADLSGGTASGDVDLGAVKGNCVFDRVDGDLRARQVGGLQLGTINGDLDVGAIQERCSVQEVKGDLRAREVSGLSVQSVNGDLDIERASGKLDLQRVQGDATLRGAFAGFGPARIHGDLSLDMEFQAGEEYELSVAGDVTLTLAQDQNVTLHARVRGDVSGLSGEHAGREVQARWGTGAATLRLTVDGDLNVRGGAPKPQAPAPSSFPDIPEAPAAPPAPAAAPAFSARVVREDARKEIPSGQDSELAVLEAVARGELSPEEADALLTGQR